MRTLILVMFLLVTCMASGQASKKHVYKNQLYPGLSASYLSTWVLRAYRFKENIQGNVFILGVNGHQEIWKESVLKFGVGMGKIFGPQINDDNGIILPIKLQKFFVPERKGFNLSVGLVSDFCKICSEGFDSALTNEISYLIDVRILSINAGLQIMEGSLFDDLAVNVGVQVELIYRPEKVGK